MQRTLNYTRRQRIEQKQACFSFSDLASKIPEFNVKFDIDSGSYPKGASIYVEAYRKETRQRFYFGTVEKIVPPKNRELDQIDLSGSTLFRVIIVDESVTNGLLLASGDGFRADESDEHNSKSSLLTVVARDLGQVPWKVDMETCAAPELCINKKIPDALGKMRNDFVFQALVLPAALKQILSFYLWDETESEFSERWFAFAENYAERPDALEPRAVIDWVEEVVEHFTDDFEFSDRLISYIEDAA